MSTNTTGGVGGSLPEPQQLPISGTAGVEATETANTTTHTNQVGAGVFERVRADSETSASTAISSQASTAISSQASSQSALSVARLQVKREISLEAYAHALPESSRTRPILAFFKSFYVKCCRILRLSPHPSDKMAVSYAILGRSMAACPTPMNFAKTGCPKSISIDYMKRVFKESAKEREVALQPKIKDLKTLQKLLNECDPGERDAIEDRIRTFEEEIKTVTRLIEEEKEFARVLDESLAITRELERLQSKKKLKADDKDLTSLEKYITAKIDRLPVGKKLLIPSGWYSSEDDFHDGCLEIMRKEDGTFDVQYLSLDEAFSAEKAKFENVAADKLKESIDALLQIQLPHVHRKEKEGKVGFFQRNLSTLTTMMVGSSGEAGDSQALNPLNILFHVFGQDPVYVDQARSDPPLHNIAQQETTMRTMMCYLNSYHGKEVGEKMALEMEIRAYQDVYKQALPCARGSKEMRLEMIAVGRELIKKMEGNSHFNKDDTAIKKIVSQLQKIKDVPFTPKEWKLQPIREDGLVQSGFQLQGLKKGAKVAKVESIELPPLCGIEGLSKRLELCKQLYNEGCFALLQVVTEKTISEIPLSIGGLREDQLLEFQSELYSLSQYIFECQRVKDVFGANSKTVFSLAKLQTLSQLCLESYEMVSGNFLVGPGDRVCVAPSAIIDLLRNDPYFRLSDPLMYRDAEIVLQFWEEKEAAMKQQTITPEHARDGRITGLQVDTQGKIETDLTACVEHPDFGVRCIAQQQLMERMATIWIKREAAFSVEPLAAMKIGMEVSKKYPKAKSEDLWIATSEIKKQKVRNWLKQPAAKVKGERGFFSFEKQPSTKLKGLPVFFDLHPTLPPSAEKALKKDLSSAFRGDGLNVRDAVHQQVITFTLAEVETQATNQSTPQGALLTAESDALADLRLTATSASRLQQTAALFMSDPKRFQDPSERRVFLLNMLKPGALKKEPPEFLDTLIRFFEEQYQMAANLKDLSNGVMFAELKMQFTLIQHRIQNDALPNKDFFKQFKLASDFERAHEISREQKVVRNVFELNRLATISDWLGKEALEEDELLGFLDAYIELKAEMNPQDPIDPLTMRKIEETLTLLLCDSTKRAEIEGTVADLFTKRGVKGEIKNRFPLFTVDRYAIDLKKGLFMIGGITQGYLPDHPLLKRIMGIEALQRNCEVQTLVDKEGHAVTVYKSKTDPRIRVIEQEGKPLRIQKELKESSLFGGKSWYELVDFSEDGANTSRLPEIGSSLFLVNDAWISLANPTKMVLTSQTTQEKEYVVTLARGTHGYTIGQIKKLKGGLILMNPWRNPPKVLGQLEGIDSRENILVFGKGKKLKEIVFPRLSTKDGPLTYRVDKDKLKLGTEHLQLYSTPSSIGGSSSDIEEAEVERHVVEGILPTLFQEYHYLQGNEAQGRLLIGGGKMTPSDPKAPLFYRASFDRSASTAHLYTYEIDLSKKELKAESKEGYAQLAYIFAMHGDFDTANNYLIKSQTNVAMSERHQEILTWVQESLPDTKEAIAFKLKAMILLRKARGHMALEEDVLEMAHLQKLKKAYESGSNYPSYLTLSEEEGRLLEQITQSDYFFITKEMQPEIPAPTFVRPTPPAKSTHLDQKAIEALVNSLWLDVGAYDRQVSSKEEFSIISEKRLTIGFKALYQEIYGLQNQERLLQLKREIQIASPRSAIAKLLKDSLLALIAIKEQGDVGEDYAFPKVWEVRGLPDRFKMTRRFNVLKLTEAMGQIDAINQKNEAERNEYESAMKIFVDTHPVTQLSALLMRLQESLPEVEKEVATPKSDLEKLITRRVWDEEAKLESARQIPEQIITEVMNAQGFRGKTREDIAGDMVERVKEKSPEEVAEELGIQAGHHARVVIVRHLERSKRLMQADQILQTYPDNLIEALKILYQEGLVDKIRQDKREIALEEKLHKNARANERVVEKMMKKAALNPSIKTQNANQTPPTIAEQSDLMQDLSTTLNSKPEERRLWNELLVDTEIARDKEWAHVESEEEVEVSALSTKQQLQDKRDALFERLLLLVKGVDRTRLTLSATPFTSQLPQRLLGLYAQGLFTAEALKKELGIDLGGIDADAKAIEGMLEAYMDAHIAFEAGPGAVRSYDGENALYKKELRIIEYTNGYYLRDEQVKTIEAMLQGENAIKQLGMGAGKSSVILPTLLAKYADGEHLAIGIIPEWLWEIVANDLDKSSHEIFNQKLHHFVFDRNTIISREFLLTQYVAMTDAILQKNAVIATKTSLLSFRNRYIELVKQLQTAEESERPALYEKIELMANVLLLLKERGKAIADEVDSILDVRKELNYSIGQPAPLDESKCNVAIQLNRKIVDWLKIEGEDPRKDFAQKFLKNEQASLSDEARERILSGLAGEMYDALRLMDFGIEKDAFVQFIRRSPASHESPQYLMVSEQIGSLGVGQPELYKNIKNLRLLLNTFEGTLKASNKVGYGRKEGGIETIPYKASNTPAQAEFGDETERIAYLIQDYLQEGLSTQQREDFIERLNVDIKEEMKAKKNEPGNVEENEKYRAFTLKWGVTPVQARESKVEQERIRQALKNSPSEMLEFVQAWVLPKIYMAKEQVSSNAQDFVDLFDAFSGFTGTTWNLHTFHEKANISAAKTEGTDGKSLLFLLEGCPDLQIRTVNLQDGRDTTVIQKIIEQYPDFFNRYDALIDAGAYMKGVSNLDVARALVQEGQRHGKESAIFTDDANQKMRLGREGTLSPLDSKAGNQDKKAITIYDQGHVIGTDIAHHKNARAAVTIGADLFVKDLFQAIWRMRKLGIGMQQIDFILTVEVDRLIREKLLLDEHENITPLHIVQFCTYNQGRRVAEDNLRAEKQKIAGYIRQELFWDIVQKGARKEEGLAQQSLSHHFKTIGDNEKAGEQLLEKGPTQKVLKELRQKELKTLEGGAGEVVEKALARLESHKFLAKDQLPETTEKVGSELADAQGSQVETETEQQQQQQQQMSVQSSLLSGQSLAAWLPWEEQNLEGVWNKLQGCVSLNALSGAIDGAIKISPNFLPGVKEVHQVKSAYKAERRHPIAQVLVIENPRGEKQLCLIDVLEYEKFIIPLLEKEAEGFKAAVYDVRTDPTIGSFFAKTANWTPMSTGVQPKREVGAGVLAMLTETDAGPSSRQSTSMNIEPITQLRLLAGQLSFDDKELAYVKDWLREGNHLQEVMGLLPFDRREKLKAIMK